MTPIVVALVSSAIALVVGSVVSKVYFTAKIRTNSMTRESHEDLMQRQKDQFQKKYTSLHNRARHKIGSQQQTIVEKDKEISKLLSDACNQSSVDSSAKKLVDILRAEIVALRENLDARDQRVSELNLEVRDAQAEAQEYLTRLDAWKQKVSPLSEKLTEQQGVIHSLQHELTSDTQQLQMQREVIQALENEVTSDSMKLKQQQEVIHALAEEVTSASESGVNFAQAMGHEEPENSSNPENEVDGREDDLKAIRGIGPALERRLRDSGIRRYRQLAEMSEEDLAELARKLSISPSLASRNEWIEQARELA